MSATPNAIRHMFESVSLGSPENSVGFVFWRITARYQREMDRALEPLSLTNLQFVSLALTAWFSRTGDPPTQAQIARFGGIHPMQLSQMFKALEQKEFITRHPSPTDSRAKEVRVTRSGLATLRQAIPLAIAVQSKLFGETGRPKGALHQTLLEIDRALNAIEE